MKRLGPSKQETATATWKGRSAEAGDAASQDLEKLSAHILDDLDTHAMSFNSMELTNERIQIYGPVGVLTGDSTIAMVRDGRESRSSFRLVEDPATIFP